MNRMQQFRLRLILVAAAMGFWMLLILGRTFFLIGPERAENLQKGEQLARKSGLIPAVRGKIIDRDGTVLAWSERYFDLKLKPGKTLQKKTSVFLTEVLGTVEPHEDFICQNLSGEEFAALQSHIRKYPELQLTSRVERRTLPEESLKKQIGECREIDGILTGVSGLEKEYDEHLRGQAGKYEVLLDRYRNWIGRSLNITLQPHNGKDIVLMQNLINPAADGGENAK